MFQEWLEATAARHQDLLARSNSSKFQGREKPKTNTFAANSDSADKPKKFDCPMKDGQHALWSCEKFKAMKIGERREFLQKARLCFNCFSPAHISRNCTSKPCNISNCGKKHNRLLHYEPKKQETTANVSDATTA